MGLDDWENDRKWVRNLKCLCVNLCRDEALVEISCLGEDERKHLHQRGCHLGGSGCEKYVLLYSPVCLIVSMQQVKQLRLLSHLH